MLALFVCSSVCWTDLLMTTVSHTVMSHIDGAKQKKMQKIFLRSADDDLSKNLSKLSTWMNYVERPPFNLKCFNHWKFYRTPYYEKQRDYIPKYQSTRENLITVTKESAKKIYSGVLSSSFMWSMHLKILFAGMCDVHTPLHVSEYFSDDFPDGDRNGQLFKIKYNNTEMSIFDLYESGCGLDPKVDKTFSKPFWENVGKLSNELNSMWDPTTFSSEDEYIEQAKTDTFEYTINNVYKMLKPNDKIDDTYISACQEHTKKQMLKSAQVLYVILNRCELTDVETPDGDDSGSIIDTINQNTIPSELREYLIYLTYLFMIAPLTVMLVWKRHCAIR